MGLGNITFGGNNIRSGLFADRPINPVIGDQYICTDTQELLICSRKKGYDISTAVFKHSIDTQDLTPMGICFNNDGTKLYEVGVGSDKIHEYELSTAYDISTAVFTQSIDTQDAKPADICFNNDGTKLYEVGYESDKIYECELSTAYDISTAVFTQSIDTQDLIPMGICFNNDGTKLYEVGSSSDKIYEYELSTAYDISTATYTQSIDTQDTEPRGICFNNDGTKLYEVGRSSDKIYEYELSTAYDISTATYTQSIDTQDSSPQGICFNDDGTKLYEVGVGSDKIYEYELTKLGAWERAIPKASITKELQYNPAFDIDYARVLAEDEDFTVPSRYTYDSIFAVYIVVSAEDASSISITIKKNGVTCCMPVGFAVNQFVRVLKNVRYFTAKAGDVITLTVNGLETDLDSYKFYGI
jgi:sugar lactone lactonase YvrE